jgi:hypothetical protein
VYCLIGYRVQIKRSLRLTMALLLVTGISLYSCVEPFLRLEQYSTITAEQEKTGGSGLTVMAGRLNKPSDILEHLPALSRVDIFDS